MRIDKRRSLLEVLELVPDAGARLAIGGLTLYRRPMAFCLALAFHARGHGTPRDLQLLAFTAGIESDILVGEALVERVRTCYFGLEAFGFAPNFTAAAQSGNLTIVEESEASLASGLRASMAGIGFIPSTAWIGTDMPNLRQDVKTVIDPYSGEELTAFPAIEVDVAVIHALEADHAGNARIGGNPGVDPELALVAPTVIITAERVVPALERAEIIGPMVTAVVESPGGAWPTSCHPNYPLDGEAILAYVDAAGTDDYAKLLLDWQQRLTPSK